jgi:hypothetical protein
MPKVQKEEVKLEDIQIKFSQIETACNDAKVVREVVTWHIYYDSGSQVLYMNMESNRTRLVKELESLKLSLQKMKAQVIRASWTPQQLTRTDP